MEGSEVIKTQGRPIPGIDYGVGMVSRKKNYDEDGNSLDDYSDNENSPGFMTGSGGHGSGGHGSGGHGHSLSPTPSIKSYRTNTDELQQLESPRSSNYSNISRPRPISLPRNDHDDRVSDNNVSKLNILDDDVSIKDKNTSQPTWLNDRNFMGDYDDDKKSYDIDAETVIEPPKMTFMEIQRAKEDYIAKLARLESKGYRSVKMYSLTSELKDIEDAYNKTYSQYSCDKAIKFQGKILIGVVGCIEGLNKKYDPFNIYLTGWSEALYENLDEYDEVFEELFEKYREQFEMISPEAKLFGMVVMSGVMFHFSHAVIAKAKKMMPGFDAVMNENPELKKQYVDAAARQGQEKQNGADSSKGFLSNLFGGIPMLNTIMKNMNKPAAPKNSAQAVQAAQPKGPSQSPSPTQNLDPKSSSMQYNQSARRERQNNTKTEFSKQNYADDLLRSLSNTKRKDISEMESIGDLSEDD